MSTTLTPPLKDISCSISKPRVMPASDDSGSSDSAVRHHSSMFLGIEALMVLLKEHRSLGITQLAERLGLSKSTMHDLAAALCSLGFVAQNQTTRRYAISPEIFRFLHLVSTEF